MTIDHDDITREVSRLIRDFTEAFDARDADALDRHYVTGAVVVPVPGHPLTGDAAKAAKRHVMERGMPIHAELRRVYHSGDVALALTDWRIGDPDDGGFAGTATDVLRRVDGRWRYVIDNPFGTA
ncbi:ketosteroid isomerase-like protein [Stackebrandtia albiflava]|uniref:Ketosteroid isomerase-like protein n=1 Tax=Stackebrandtia albiflava TaxID=406432 RepID=A0A562V4Q0_9ACTN|nr:nuclear transport factor 2 family protein [Stackebrandtia albiflava]TWJ12871.1 ketosteroid isomerase-like protein [Stackebrandtia albiflava]